MRNPSHKTLISTVRTAVVEWRKREGWSRESVVQVIVEAHERIEGPTTTGIVFDPATRDAFDRTKVNADRVFRWLDDESKDNNLLPANFLPSVLAALPIDLRLQALGEILRPLGLVVSSADEQDAPAFDRLAHATAITKETAEAVTSVLSVGPNASPAQISAARKELADVRQVIFEAERSLCADTARAE